VSTPRSLKLPDRVRPASLQTARGSFAALAAQPASGVCERQPALLIPGYTGSKEDFLPVLESIAAAGRMVVAIDLRGQYESPAAADRGGYSADELAADVAAVASEVAQDDAGVHLLGHSFGGLIARAAVLAQAASVASLTLLGSGPAGIGGLRAAFLRQLLSELDPGAGQAADDVALLRRKIKRVWDEYIEPQARADGTPEHIITFLRKRTLSTCPVGLIAMGRYLLHCPDRTRELADRHDVPILVIYGENDDAWPPAVQDRMAKRLHAERVCIPGAAHAPAVEAPETTASTLTTFWNAAERSERRRAATGHAPSDSHAPHDGSREPARRAGSATGHSSGADTVAGRPTESGSASLADASPSQGRRGTAADPPSGH
jgi:pimeloyl-ACP methyl ester carboxylesterase